MLVLVDTSVWIDHLRQKNTELIALLEQNLILVHSAIIGELACGNLKRRNEFIQYLQFLPTSQEASSEEVLEMIENRHLYGKGINWVDV
ncbi:MAG: VapC toxin family PIN domain ribonuclease, partial [Deltaproteobacteria bacterium]|nr:VapC toxin family PIN domain ribonuclease [Deltaproteobacteria bacterium]